MYNRARYYKSDIARFISEDPIGFQAGFHRYKYASLDPIKFIDFSGLKPTFQFCTKEQEQIITYNVWINTIRMRTCIECDYFRKRFEQYFDQVTYTCTEGNKLKTCASTLPGGPPSTTYINIDTIHNGDTIQTLPSGNKCDCIQSILIHEATHEVFPDHDDHANVIAKKCWGNCASNMPHKKGSENEAR